MKRSLGLWDVALFFLIAGTNLQWVAAAGASGPSSLVVWVIGGLAMFVPLSICVAYLTAIYPEEGGLYAWTKHEFGPMWGFLAGWMYWASNLPYLPTVLYFAVGNALFAWHGAAGTHASPWVFIAFSLAGLAFGTIVNIYGLDVAKWLNDVGGVSRWLVTFVLVGIGIFAFVRFGSATSFDVASMRPHLSIVDLIFWTNIAIAYAGPESVAFLAGEIKDPRRAIPLGLAIAAPFIVLLYIAGTASVLVAIPPHDVDSLYGVTQTIAVVANKAGVPWIVAVAGVLVTVSCFGSVGAWLCSIARLPFAAGLDAYLPRAFGWMHPRYASPVVALVVQAVITAFIAILGQGGTTVKGAYDVLVSMAVLTTILPYVFLFGAALRTKQPMPAGLAIPGGRATVVATAWIGMLATIVIVICSAIPSPDEANKPLAVAKIVGLAAILILAGYALYTRGERLKRAA